MADRISDVLEHIEQAGGKLKDLTEVHLPAIAGFMKDIDRNPLVTSVAAAIDGPLSADAMAILNGLLPLLHALGGAYRSITPAAETPATEMPAIPAGAGDPAPAGSIWEGGNHAIG